MGCSMDGPGHDTRTGQKRSVMARKRRNAKERQRLFNLHGGECHLCGGCVVTGKEEDIARPDDLFIGYSNFASREGLLEFKQNTFSRRFPEYTRRSWPAPDGQMRQFAKGKSGSTVYRGITVKSEFLTPNGEG